MKTRKLEDIAPAETFETARRLFAGSGRIFDLHDHSVDRFRDVRRAAEAFQEKIRQSKKDFWIYETDSTPIPTAVTRISIQYEERRGPATDLAAASEGKLRYINRRAQRAGLALVDYVEDRRPVIYKRVAGRYTPITFSIHALRRFYERNETGTNQSNFTNIPIAHIWNSNLPRIDSTASEFTLRTDLMVPYERGAFLGSATMKPNYTYVYENDQFDRAQSQDHGMTPAFNAITYIGESQMSSFQRRMYEAIQKGDHSRYHDLARKDLKQTGVSLG